MKSGYGIAPLRDIECRKISNHTHALIFAVSLLRGCPEKEHISEVQMLLIPDERISGVYLSLIPFVCYRGSLSQYLAVVVVRHALD